MSKLTSERTGALGSLFIQHELARFVPAALVFLFPNCVPVTQISKSSARHTLPKPNETSTYRRRSGAKLVKGKPMTNKPHVTRALVYILVIETAGRVPEADQLSKDGTWLARLKSWKLSFQQLFRLEALQSHVLGDAMSSLDMCAYLFFCLEDDIQCILQSLRLESFQRFASTLTCRHCCPFCRLPITQEAPILFRASDCS